MDSLPVGVLGIGEVGKAISEVFSEKFHVLKKDLKFDELKNSNIEVLHVCIPYTDNFEKAVLLQIVKNNPKLTIIHSTVMPGTTQNIFKKSKKSIVHSPVMGTHPNLAKDIRIFKKIIGPVDKKSEMLAKAHFKKTAIKFEVFKTSLESEIAKLLDTTYYGWNIIFSKIVWDICKKTETDFENVYTNLNKIYNEGYSKSRSNVIRPILKYQHGPVGGHCIIPNAEILNKYFSNSASEIILKINDQFKKSQ